MARRRRTLLYICTSVVERGERVSLLSYASSTFFSPSISCVTWKTASSRSGRLVIRFDVVVVDVDALLADIANLIGPRPRYQPGDRWALRRRHGRQGQRYFPRESFVFLFRCSSWRYFIDVYSLSYIVDSVCSPPCGLDIAYSSTVERVVSIYRVSLSLS